ncbi:MAG: hypothetical protein IJD76_03650 [Bacilli bacterium]|nr:hypothetical protein [Bacilli bacterium]
MKKTISIFSIICLLFLLCSCGTVTEVKSAKKYIKKIYDYEINRKEEVVYIDLRVTGVDGTTNVNEYAYNHLLDAVNYNYEKGNKEEFLYWVQSVSKKEQTIFLFDSGNNESSEVASWLESDGYNKIYYFTGSYIELREHKLFDELLIEVSGTEGCDC